MFVYNIISFILLLFLFLALVSCHFSLFWLTSSDWDCVLFIWLISDCLFANRFVHGQREEEKNCIFYLIWHSVYAAVAKYRFIEHKTSICSISYTKCGKQPNMKKGETTYLARAATAFSIQKPPVACWVAVQKMISLFTFSQFKYRDKYWTRNL